MAPRQLYQAKPFTEPPPQMTRTPPPPFDPSKFKVQSAKGRETIDARAHAAALESYRTEKAAYDQERAKYDADLASWRDRKGKWDQSELAKEDTDRAQSDAPLQARQQAQGVFDKTAMGQIAPYAKGAAYPAGSAAGLYEGLALSKLPWAGVKNPANVGLGPRAAVAAILAGLSAKSMAVGQEEREDAENPNASPAEEASTKTFGNFLVGQGIGGLGGAALGATPGLMARYEKESSAGSPLPMGDRPAGPTAPPEPLLNLKGKVPSDAAREILTKLGVTPAEKLKDNKDLILKAVPKADPAVQAAIEASHADFSASDPEGLAGSIVKRLGKTGKAAKLAAVPLGILGAGAALTGSGEADAGPRRDESLTDYRLRQLGMGSPAEAADTASYYVPYVGPARVAADVGTALGGVARTALDRATAPKSVMPQDPRFANLGAARAEDARQRAEPASRREEIGSEAVNATPGKPSADLDQWLASATHPSSASTFDPSDLPDYERGLLEKGISPSAAAAHLIPHARAGAEAVRRGEDFWGGSDQYERQRNALQAFYGMANKDADAITGDSTAAKPKAIPAPPSSPASSANDDTLPYAKGGKVAARTHADAILRRYAARRC